MITPLHCMHVIIIWPEKADARLKLGVFCSSFRERELRALLIFRSPGLIHELVVGASAMENVYKVYFIQNQCLKIMVFFLSQGKKNMTSLLHCFSTYIFFSVFLISDRNPIPPKEECPPLGTVVPWSAGRSCSTMQMSGFCTIGCDCLLLSSGKRCATYYSGLLWTEWLWCRTVGDTLWWSM